MLSVCSRIPNVNMLSRSVHGCQQRPVRRNPRRIEKVAGVIGKIESRTFLARLYVQYPYATIVCVDQGLSVRSELDISDRAKAPNRIVHYGPVACPPQFRLAASIIATRQQRAIG